MALPTPSLDDRRFQDLVDDAKRLVQERCPEWTDHNVSDPGVTLIEVFAWMTDQLLYRLNRVPDLNYLKFLELLGIRRFPPAGARSDLTFWLSSQRPETVRVPARAEVSTRRVDGEDPVVFTTDRDLAMPPCTLAALASTDAGGTARRHPLPEPETAVFAFSALPEPGEAFLVGLSAAVPSCAVILRVDARIEGIGVDPANPPLEWEAWTGDDWEVCEVARDETGGLNRAGDILLHVPRGHVRSILASEMAGWLRCRLRDVEEGAPFYISSPEIVSLSAFTIGGTVDATHARQINGEILGVSEGVAGQRFQLEQAPVVLEEDLQTIVEVTTGEGWEEWEEVPSFSESDADSRHFMLDPASGEITLGPAVREPDGTLRRYGAVPPNGAMLRIRSYLTGGGPRGNVARGVLSVLRKPIPYVASVENRRQAVGGVAGETIENVKVRGPLALRAGDRAVTAADYEQLAREAAPEVARVAAVGAEGEAEAGGLRVLVVPAVPRREGRLRFEQLEPHPETVAKIGRFLDTRRVLGVRVVVEPPLYVGLRIAGLVRMALGADKARVEADALAALNGYFDPLLGGPDGDGWPFGRPVLSGEVYSLLQKVRGVETVEDVRMFAADPTTNQVGAATDRLELPPHALVFSYQHRILAEPD